MSLRRTIARTVATLTLAAPLALGACAGPEEPEWNQDAEQATVALVESLSAVAAIAGPTSDATLGDGAKAEGSQEALEDAVTTSWVVDPACVSVTWQGLSLTATFDGCVLAATSESLDGAVTARVSFFPTTLSLSFADLAVGEHSFDGSVALVFRGKAPAIETTLAIDMHYSGSGADLDLDEVAVTVDPVAASVTLDGSGSVNVAGAGLAADAAALTWAAGECLPSSGDVVVDQGLGPITVTFLATTPGDGVVTVQLGTLPPFQQQLFAPCP